MNLTEFSYHLNLFPSSDGKSYIAVSEAQDKDDDFLQIELLKSVDEFIKKNPSTKEVTSPIFFIRPGQPDPDGLLSNEIFGITKDQRAGIYGYIDLSTWFIHPLVYKKLFRLDRRFREVVHGTKKFVISEDGELIYDDNGHTGISWLKSNFSKIKFKRSSSDKRDNVIKFIKFNQDRMWMNKLLVLPAFYRDVNTKSEGKVAVGEINELYSSLIMAVRSIKETADFGLDISDSVKGRIQETILAIYDWLIGNNNDSLDGGTGLSKKLGYIKRAGQSKTTDYGSRLVLSAPELKVNTTSDMMVDVEHVAIPLASICANFYPYMLYNIRSIFENTFVPEASFPVYSKSKGKVEYVKIVDARNQFSDDVIKEELQRFIHGYSNRLAPVEIKLEDGRTGTLQFKASHGKAGTDEVESLREIQPGDPNMIMRTLTWCDIFYIAACEATKDKHVLITRYPIKKSVA